MVHNELAATDRVPSHGRLILKRIIFSIAATIFAATIAPGTQAQSSPVAMKTTRIKVDSSAYVEFTHVDSSKFNISDGANPKPIHVKAVVSYLNSSGSTQLDINEFELKGKPGWSPWSFGHAIVMDVDGDGQKDIVFTSSCSHGGSGTVEYLTIFRRTKNTFTVMDPLMTVSSNIHGGAFFPATINNKNAFVVTEPLDRAEKSRADARLWKIETYQFAAGNLVKLNSTTTKQRFSEKVPTNTLKSMLPAGWQLGQQFE